MAQADTEQDGQLSLPGVAVGEPPREALEYLSAVRHHHHAHKGKVRLQDVHMAPLLHMSLRAWQRRKQELRGRDAKRRLGGYDWFEGVWPPDAEWRPSWEPQAHRAAPQRGEANNHQVFRRVDPAFDLDGNPVLLENEETYTADGIFVSRRLIKSVVGHVAALAAGLSVYALLDLHDGSLDHVVHWCNVLLEHFLSAMRG